MQRDAESESYPRILFHQRCCKNRAEGGANLGYCRNAEEYARSAVPSAF